MSNSSARRWILLGIAMLALSFGPASLLAGTTILQFQRGQSRLTRPTKQLLQKQIQELKRQGGKIRITLRGHSHCREMINKRKRLSRDRARGVKAFLVASLGNRLRVTIKVLGCSHPLKDARGRQLYRYVALQRKFKSKPGSDTPPRPKPKSDKPKRP